MNVSHHDKEVTDNATPLLRLGHVMAFSNFLNQIGAPYERHLERHILPVACDDPNCYVSIINAWAFFADVTRIEDPMLAWLVGRSTGDHNLNPDLLKKLNASPSLYRALHTFLAIKRSEATALKMGVVERNDDVLLFTHYPGRSAELGYHQAQAYQIGVVLVPRPDFIG